MKSVPRKNTVRVISTIAVAALLATAAPAMAAALSDAPVNPLAAKFASLLEPNPVSFVKLERVYSPLQLDETPAVASTPVANTEPVAALAVELTEATVKVQAPVPVAQAPVKPATSSGTSTATRPSTSATGDETAQARAILAGLIAQYPILQGVTVSMGDTPNNYQAVAYYESGRIVVNPAHTASLSRILSHEVWHIIDWRDNGVIDWGENVPPR